MDFFDRMGEKLVTAGKDVTEGKRFIRNCKVKL